MLALSAGCEDAPTVPHALRQHAGGQDWLAIPAPAGLPRPAEWLPYLRADGASQAGVLRRVQVLRERAEAARKAGRIGDARAAEEEAVRLALPTLQGSPPPSMIQGAVTALGLWVDRAGAEAELAGAPGLAANVEVVRATRALAVAALASGDTASAVRYVVAAESRVREHEPGAVALRVLARVAKQMQRSHVAEGRAASRLEHLVGAARQELAQGDPGRALLRALYALQLAGGGAIPDDDLAPDASLCPGPACLNPQ